LLAILKGPELKVADIPVEHRVDAVRREALALPDQQSFFGSRNYYSDGGGGNFFSRLFGGGDQQPGQRSRRAQGRQEIR
jgi:hypothetical protein